MNHLNLRTPTKRLIAKRIRLAGWSIALISLASGCGPSVAEQFRTNYSDDYNIRRSKSSTYVTGTACAKSESEAIDASIDQAKFNLIDVIGHDRRNYDFQVLRVYLEGERVCAKVAAKSN